MEDLLARFDPDWRMLSRTPLRRHLSEVRSIFRDQEAVDRILREEGDRLVYEVHAGEVPEAEGHVAYCTTIIYPGTVGEEFHMTRGHFHSKRGTGEVYLGLRGRGLLLLRREEGPYKVLEFGEGIVAYVPPFWGHRTVNTGKEPLVFFAAWPADAGHDYALAEELGFGVFVLCSSEGYRLVESPSSLGNGGA